MKDVLRKLKKHWITVWLICVALILGTFITYAVYTEVSTVKRVVSTKSAPKELFSSNCMYAELSEKRMPAREYNVNVNNFDLNSPETPNPSPVEYTLTAQLHVKYQGSIMTFDELGTRLGSDTATYNEIVARAGGYRIGKSQDNNISGIISSPSMTEFSAGNNFTVVFGPTAESPNTPRETLPGNTASTDRFRVQIPEEDFNKTDPEFYVYVAAKPVDSGLNELKTRLYGSKNVVVTAAWSGTLAEKNTDEKDYDFYNYVISGSGSGKLDIMWDDEWFEIDDFFFTGSLSGVEFDESSLDGEGHVVVGTVSGGTYNGWKKVTILVDSSEGKKSRYELQLYKTKENTPYTGNNDAADHIRCELQ